MVLFPGRMPWLDSRLIVAAKHICTLIILPESYQLDLAQKKKFTWTSSRSFMLSFTHLLSKHRMPTIVLEIVFDIGNTMMNKPCALQTVNGRRTRPP